MKFSIYGPRRAPSRPATPGSSSVSVAMDWIKDSVLGSLILRLAIAVRFSKEASENGLVTDVCVSITTPKIIEREPAFDEQPIAFRAASRT